jgi:hypothetical protein
MVPMNDLLKLAVAAHGGLDRWNQVNTLEAKVTLTGLLWRIKGRPDRLRGVVMRADTKRPALTISPFPAPGQSGRFTPECVWIDDDAGNVVSELNQPRASFKGHVLTTTWTELQELYFAAYAFWNYFTTPFLLTYPGVQAEEVETLKEDGETWRSLSVTFPSDIPTHCANQTFYFNEKGLLQRTDYVTEVAGGVAAHYCFDHTAFDGIVVPTLRRVVPRTPAGPAVHGSSAVLIGVSDVSLS